MSQGKATTLKGISASRDAEYFAYESLPKEVREQIQKSLICFSAVSIARQMNKGTSADIVIRSMIAAERRELDARAMAQVWGTYGHPQAIVRGPTVESLGL